MLFCFLSLSRLALTGSTVIFFSLSLFSWRWFFSFFFFVFTEKERRIFVCWLKKKKKGKTNLISKPFCLAAFPLPPPSLSPHPPPHLLLFVTRILFWWNVQKSTQQNGCGKKGKMERKKTPVNCKNCRKEEKSNKEKRRNSILKKKYFKEKVKKKKKEIWL